MFSSRFISRISSLFVFILALLPAFANAQESSAPQPETQSIQVNQKKDNFGGLRLGANLTFGGGAFDYIDSYKFAALLQLETGYLWGNHVFVGPVINFSIGFPMLLNGDIRLRMIIPVSESNAISWSAGWGMFGHIAYDVDEEKIFNPSNFHGNCDEKEVKAVNYMYIPIQIGFEHVFDNRFILGATAQINLALYNQRYDYYSTHEKYMDYYARIGREYKVKVMVGTFTAGIHLGYKF